MLKKIVQLTFLLLLIIPFSSDAQVTGISYTISPNAEYTFWDNKAGIEDGLLVGGKFGFGFGQYFEVRGNYMQTLDAKTNFADFGLENYSDDLFTARDVKVTRWGGDIKANLSKGKFLPFITIGTGVQSIGLDTFAVNRQIYLNAGLGIILSAADRYTLVLEARNTAYRFNAGSNLLTEEDKATFGVSDETFESEDLTNWSVGASLQFYLGGRKPGELSSLDKAYFNSITGGFKSLGGTIEPTIGKLNFDESLAYRDTWVAGGSAGFDFGPYIGVRGFYFQAIEDGEVSEFDQLAMYGGELRMRLNTSTGIVPFIMLGGGKIDVQDDYESRTIMLSDSTTMETTAEDRGFALGGLGLTLPLSKNLKIFGSARALLTTGSMVEDLQGPDEIQTSWMYNTGLLLNFGKGGKDPSNLVDAKVNDALVLQRAENELKTEELKNQYELKVLELEQKLNEALAKEDYAKAAELKQEKLLANQVVAELENRQQELAQQQQLNALNNISSGSSIRMSPAEFENLIEEILENMGSYSDEFYPQVQSQMLNNSSDNTADVLKEQEINRRTRELEKQITIMSVQQEQLEKNVSDQLRRDLGEFTKQLEQSLNQLDDKLNQNRQDMIRMNDRINSLEGGNGTSSNTPQKNNNTTIQMFDDAGTGMGNIPSTTKNNTRMNFPAQTTMMQDTMGVKKFFRNVRYTGMSGFAGFSLGGTSTANIGFRWHYALGNKGRIEFMPEAFFGVGSSDMFGISGNFIAPIKLKNSPIRPYVGAGLGLLKIDESEDSSLQGAYNIILGSYVNVWRGRLYVDLMGRNLFENTQIVAGYRFPF